MNDSYIEKFYKVCELIVILKYPLCCILPWFSLSLFISIYTKILSRNEKSIRDKKNLKVESSCDKVYVSVSKQWWQGWEDIFFCQSYFTYHSFVCL